MEGEVGRLGAGGCCVCRRQDVGTLQRNREMTTFKKANRNILQKQGGEGGMCDLGVILMGMGTEFEGQ